MIPPVRLAPAPRDAIRRSLLAKGMIEPAAIEAPDEKTAWKVNGVPAHYRLAEAGLSAATGSADAGTPAEAPTMTPHLPEAPNAASFAQEPPAAPTEAFPTLPDRQGLRAAAEAVLAATGDVDAGTPAEAPTTAPHAPEAHETAPPAREPPAAPAEAFPALPVRQRLRTAAEAVLAVWDEAGTREARLPDAIVALCAAVAGKPNRPTRDLSQPRKPREGTKQQQVLAMLRRPEGATVAQIAEATGWQAHTVRGFFAGLKRRQGIAVEAAERVHQVGAGKEGAKGSYTVYRIAEAG